MTKTNENGRSMVEMLGVLAIIGVLSAGGLAGYSKAMYKYRVNETMNQLTMIVSNIRTLFGSQNTYEGLDVANALQYGIVTADMYTSADAVNKTSAAIKNPFKGDVIIGTSNGRGTKDGVSDGDDMEAFYIEYDKLPAEACVTIVTSDWGAGAGSGLIGIAAHGTDGKDAYTAGTTNTIGGGSDKTNKLDKRLITQAVSDPFTIDDAVTACGAAGTGDKSGNASIALKYY